MKSKTTFIALLGIIGLSSAAPASETYNIDPVHSTVGFAITHLVINTVHGKFNEFNGTVGVENNKVTEAKGTIQTQSVDTGVAMRDKDLRGPNYFDVEKYPTITFQGKRAENNGNGTVLVGDFTMHGVTKEISLPLKLNGPIQDPWGNTRIGLEGKTKINRKDYGMGFNRALAAGGLMLGEEVEIQINAEATKAKPK